MEIDVDLQLSHEPTITLKDPAGLCRDVQLANKIAYWVAFVIKLLKHRRTREKKKGYAKSLTLTFHLHFYCGQL